MKKTIGKYATHEKAIEAVMELKRSEYPVQQVSLVGSTMTVNDHMIIKNNKWIKNVPVIVGVVLGPCLGILIGLKIIAIPGFNFLFGTGAKIGALAGFSIGIVGGGLISLISILLIKSRYFLTYDEHTKNHGFQVIAYGTTEEVNKAKKILDEFRDETTPNSPCK